MHSVLNEISFYPQPLKIYLYIFQCVIGSTLQSKGPGIVVLTNWHLLPSERGYRI